jgi:small-conductance mechanosensitive channel
VSFIKFAILATFGESLGLRIKTGNYIQKGYGFIPRALVWGFLGIVINMGFVIFGTGAPKIPATLGITSVPSDVLLQKGFSWVKLLGALSVGITINLFFAPVFMAFHKIMELHIVETKGTIRGFFTPVRFGDHFAAMDWRTFWNFILKKTIPFFWIPAQTFIFMLPEEFRILMAAIFSVILGVLLSVAGKKTIKQQVL